MNETSRIYVVADGVGGARGGGVAARAVVSILPGTARERIRNLAEETEENVKAALVEAMVGVSERLRRMTPEGTPLHGLCSTAVLALVRGRSLFVVHAGDSRAYLMEKGKLSPLTRDHSMVAVMVELGQITPEQARVHPLRSRITRCVGMEGKLIPDVRCVAVGPGCRLLLCTDGLTGMLTDEEIAEILKTEKGCQSACRKLVDAANQAGGTDNIAVVVVDFKRA